MNSPRIPKINAEIAQPPMDAELSTPSIDARCSSGMAITMFALNTAFPTAFAKQVKNIRTHIK